MAYAAENFPGDDNEAQTGVPIHTNIFGEKMAHQEPHLRDGQDENGNTIKICQCQYSCCKRGTECWCRNGCECGGSWAVYDGRGRIKPKIS